MILCLTLVAPPIPELGEGGDRAHLPHPWVPMPHTAPGRDATDISWDENVPVPAAGFGILIGQELSCWMKICGSAGWWRGRWEEGSISGEGLADARAALWFCIQKAQELFGEMGWRGVGGVGALEGGVLGLETGITRIQFCPATATSPCVILAE